MNKTHKIPDTGTVAAQKLRMKKTTEYFLKSKKESETIILSDSNINSIKINSPETEKSQQDKQTSKVAKILINTTLQAGFTIMNVQPTHNKSTIDHIITTEPAKILNVTTTNTHMSDHFMVTATRLTTKKHQEPKICNNKVI